MRDEDFDVVTAADGASALKAADRSVHAVVLDIGLPDSDRRDVCQAMRGAGSAVPVIFLTAHGNLIDRLSGFASGGVDYLVRPFHLSEPAAHVRAVLHRTGHPYALADTVRLDPVRHKVTVQDRSVALTPTEFRLLARLMAAPGEVVRRRALLRAAWPEGAHVSDNTLDRYLTRLRRKLRAADSPQTISTVRGVGHRFG
ncbi:response regulator transcription factor [Streptomyces sp. LN785]|uniref:response regulator transcription factor n=1 Tax=Streptomyces sp. LN785 TaxID=3112983 RepID=UPI00372487C3